jgi:polysaccharide export outer membrane protein
MIFAHIMSIYGGTEASSTAAHTRLAISRGDLARREGVDMAIFQLRLQQRQGILGSLRLTSVWRVFFVLILFGCAPQLPYAPPTPPQHLQQLSNQYELTNQLQDLTRLSYTLDTGDKILVQVDGRQQLSREVTVDPQGAITYPRLGTIKVSGLTLSELDQDLDSGLSRYWSKPREVRAPGVHPLAPSDSLLELVSQAGGPTPEAGWLALVIKKNDDARGKSNHAHNPCNGNSNGAVEQTNKPYSNAIRVDLDKLLVGSAAQSLRIESGDTIYIPETAYYYVYGEVDRPGRYRLKRGMTAVQAISNAGGYTAFASKKRLKVFRYHVHHEKCGGDDLCLWGMARHVNDEPPRAYRLHLHDRVQPSDVLVVPGPFGS